MLAHEIRESRGATTTARRFWAKALEAPQPTPGPAAGKCGRPRRSPLATSPPVASTQTAMCRDFPRACESRPRRARNMAVRPKPVGLRRSDSPHRQRQTNTAPAWPRTRWASWACPRRCSCGRFSSLGGASWLSTKQSWRLTIDSVVNLRQLRRWRRMDTPSEWVGGLLTDRLRADGAARIFRRHHRRAAGSG